MLITDPASIEARSMEIIKGELTVELPPEIAPVVMRVIHCTADFDYAKNLVFSPGAVERGLAALRSGCAVVTDTQMAKSGINRAAAARLGCQIHCFMSDPDVAEEAYLRGVTRAAVSMERAAGMNCPLIFALGNAPTALLTLMELTKAGRVAPELVIGVPVGFVNVIESKEALLSSPVPHIVAKGRKGGSNVAAAIVNALMYALTRGAGADG